ncbi:MAG: DUF1292 domain-containing protein [Eubacteriales bacterium]|nr:DUF1292 domain-containing protein [Eubacteriales bacterium]
MENQEMMEMEDNLIELIDEEGKATMFEHVATIEHEGETYIMVVEEEMLAKADEDENEEVEAVVLKVETDENGNDIYVSIEDEALSAIVFEKCLDALDEVLEEE